MNLASWATAALDMAIRAKAAVTCMVLVPEQVVGSNVTAVAHRLPEEAVFLKNDIPLVMRGVLPPITAKGFHSILAGRCRLRAPNANSAPAAITTMYIKKRAHPFWAKSFNNYNQPSNSSCARAAISNPD